MARDTPPSAVRDHRRAALRSESPGREPVTIQSLDHQSLEERVYDALRDAIVAGEFRPGDPLVEAQLSVRFGISKTPVREALIRLRRDGLVAAELHRVNRVATPTAEDIRQACEARMWIESALAACSAENPSDELLETLARSIEEADEALASSDPARYGEAVRQFSDAIVAASENHYAQDFLERLRNVLALIAHMSREVQGRQSRSIDEHRAIFDAISGRDPARAAEATRIHLASIERDSLNALAQHVDEAG
jgi:DNA-binding GntR family transcriptional regulator